MIKMYNDQHFINYNIGNKRKCDYYMILETYIDNNKHRIDFSNGSTIQFISASGKTRGYVPHLLIVEYNIDSRMYTFEAELKTDDYINTYEKIRISGIKDFNMDSLLYIPFLFFQITGKLRL